MPGLALDLEVLDQRLSVARLDAGAPVPAWADGDGLVSLTRTPDELSVVCEAGRVPEGVRCEADFRAFKVRGPLGFQLTGILASLVAPLAEDQVPIFAVSTFDTDYLLVRERDVPRAGRALRAAGHTVRGG